jgi:hypothetical protein
LGCDTTTEHDELTAKEILAKEKAITKFNYSPFLPNVAPFDFWLVTELKTALTRPELFLLF